jgi:hypothetical protein
MALKQTTQFKGITVADCYIKVFYIEGDKQSISFGVSYAASAQEETFNAETYACAYDITGSNPIAQAYAHLKTLPEFANAVDC